uniref:Alginate lyase domain-containing protein n=1 Tax=Eutreptiella gymnastica TaxID=73025 RepID=A0A7S1NTG0_9EUGL
MKGWFTSFLSKVDEIKSHYHPELTGLAGGAYDVLRMSLATFLGKSDIVKEQAATVQWRLEQAIKADGQTQLPVTLQMDTLAVSAELASRVGVDLWGYKTQSGGRLIDAVQALVTDANNKGQAPNVFDRTIKLAQRYAAKTEA